MHSIVRFTVLTALAAASSTLFAATADTPAAAPAAPVEAPRAPVPHERGEVRKEIRVRHLDRAAVEKENVTFLGVETAPVSATLVAQLNLPDNSGLVVLHVVPNTAAATALKPHDILLKLDDQILIDQRQLSVLIRNHKEGDEVTLTYVRGGKQTTAKVKLTTHEVPKVADVLRSLNHPLLPHEAGGRLSMAAPEAREDVERVLSLMQRSHNGDPVRIQIDHEKGSGMRAVRINPGASNLVYSDDSGSLELKVADGKKTLVATDKEGKQQFSGPVTTPEERKALPGDLRERLERLEDMQDVSFHTDADFQGADVKVLEAEGEPMSYEVPEPRPAAVAAAF